MAPAPQQAGSLMAPAPTQAGSLMAPAPAGSLMAPAPAGSLMTPSPAGSLMSPTPAGALTSEVQNATEIEDVGMKNFVVQKAVEQGKSPEQLSTSDMHNLQTEYLLLQIKLLQNQVERLQ